MAQIEVYSENPQNIEVSEELATEKLLECGVEDPVNPIETLRKIVRWLRDLSDGQL